MSSSYARQAGRWAGALSFALVAACQESATLVAPSGSSTARATAKADTVATVTWNEVARSMVVKYNTSAPATIRLFALLTVAQYNAIADAEQSKVRSLHPADRGAVAGASAAVLSYIYPQEATYFEGLVDEQQTSLVELTNLYDKMGNREMKDQLIFVYSQRREPQAVDRLMSIARNEQDRELRKKAIFWLSQSKDPRAVDFFAQILLK